MAGAAEAWQRIAAHRGVAAWALRPLAALYELAIRGRAALYRAGFLRSERLSVPVIVVGNLVAGGAGKTPTVISIVELLRRSGRRPGIVSRGYGGVADRVVEVKDETLPDVAGDEPVLLRRRTGVPVFVGRDRAAAGRALRAAHPDVDVIVTDDGLQHLRLARDVEVIVLDERGAGNGWLLPAGLLREPLPRPGRANAVVLYNASRPSTSLPGHLATRQVAGVVELAAWWRGEPPRQQALEALRGRAVVAVAGIARPERFFQALRDAGLAVEALPLPDHASYVRLPWPRDARDVVVTEKDAVKLDPSRTAPTTVWVAALDFRLPRTFESEVLRLLDRAPASTRHGNTPS
jgi:tetraacyldisaccharide 4'-kinase